MKTYIIVPVFKRLELTKKFVASIFSSTNNNVSIIIVDDSHCLENYNYFLEAKLKNVIAIHTKYDEYWCGTMRVGVNFINNKVCPDLNDNIIFANNDVTLPNGEFDKIVSHIKYNELCHPQTVTNKGFVSSGCKVLSWFPYITSHPNIAFTGVEENIRIDLCTARFLCMKYSTLNDIGNIAENLIQYHGDNDFSLRASKKGIKTYIISSCQCHLYDEDTGVKNNKLVSYREAYSSLFAIRSANNISSRYKFITNHFIKPKSIFIVMGMTMNILVKVTINKISSWCNEWF